LKCKFVASIKTLNPQNDIFNLEPYIRIVADLNADGLIDWSEFVAMMTPGDLAKCEQT